jgi:uncharacterized repeat protein (TIGR03806 family)
LSRVRGNPDHSDIHNNTSIRKSNMKPLAVIAFGLVLGLTLSACGGAGGSGNDGGGAGGGGGGGNGEPPVSGLPQRPQNSACVAFALQGAANTQAVRAFANLSIDGAITGIFQAPDDNAHWYITTKYGLLATFANDDNVSSYTRINGVPTVNSTFEGGLLGLAFHPQFASNRYVFLSYTATGTSAAMVSRITRFTLTTDNELTNAVPFLEIEQPAANHNGGTIGFGPDGYLYIGFGDGGGGGDQYGNGQNPATLLAKILRINVDQPDTTAGTQYSIPTGNPFVDVAGYREEIFAEGFRNPWKWSFDRVTDALIVADVGQNKYEEVDIVDAGENYGWPITEGRHCYPDTASCDTTGLIAPVFDYSHDDGGCSITGGFVYRGSAIPALYGKYIYGDYCASGVNGFDIANPASGAQAVSTVPSGITTFGESSDGEILLGNSDGEIYRIVASDSTQATPIPQTLSTHPCVADAAANQFTSGVIPYSVNSALWSDGADKSRFVALPDNQTISVEDDGDLQFPVGSVLIKQFSHAGVPVETRFLMHHDNGWASYSYEWNDTATDATLSTTAHDKVIDSTYTHIFPSPAQCFQCHTNAANVSLGLETAQLNRKFVYTETGITYNQLDTWQYIDLFSADLTTANRGRYMPALTDTTSAVALRARAYLHSNCSGCHRPGGTPEHLDLRFSTSLSDAGICNVNPSLGDLGIAGAKLLAPGDTSLSVIYQRMNRRDQYQMPPLASHVVDDAAVALIGEWIGAMTFCP